MAKDCLTKREGRDYELVSPYIFVPLYDREREVDEPES